MTLFQQTIRASLVCTAPLLAACGGGGGGEQRVDFSTADAAAAALIDTYVDANGDPVTGLSRSNSFVQTGLVTYDGAFTGALGGNGVVGDLSVSVTFGSGNVTGTARNIQNAATGYYSGTLTGSGNVDSAAASNLPQMTLILDGNLSDASGTQSTTLVFDGNFYSAGGNPEGAVAGEVDGTIGGVVLLDGVFAAED